MTRVLTSRDLTDRAPDEAIRRRDERLLKERHAEVMDAFLFLTEPEHDETCIWPDRGEDVCAREYDPGPDSAPHDPRMYEGTGIGSIYMLPGWENHAWRLAGWNVFRRRRRRTT